jgi:hypothetical protein
MSKTMNVIQVQPSWDEPEVVSLIGGYPWVDATIKKYASEEEAKDAFIEYVRAHPTVAVTGSFSREVLLENGFTQWSTLSHKVDVAA